MSLGLFIDGTPIMPKYNVLDDPGRHMLYLDNATVRFLKAFKPGATLNEDPVYPRMIEAGFYDGLGTLLPLGVYWYERVQAQTLQFWSLASCFDFIPLSRLSVPDAELKAYIHCLQLDKYEESAKAFRDYLRDRAMTGWEQEYFLPDYMINGDGEIIPDDNAVRDTRPGFDPAKFRPRWGASDGGEWTGVEPDEFDDLSFDDAPGIGGFDLL